MSLPQVHSFINWYIPSAPRVNYSLPVMESAGMIKMATGEGSPLRQGPDWFLVATEARGGGTPDLFCSPMVLGYMDIYRRKKSVREATRGPRGAHEGGGRTQGGGRTPCLVASSLLPLCGLQVSRVAFLPKITSPEGFIPFRLRLIFLFFETLKHGKNRNLHWALGQ